MQEQANVRLSAFELQLVTDPEWILTKNGIIQKVFALFGMLSEQYKVTLDQADIAGIHEWSSPKISKGENYQGLPYVMLDYPRVFGKEDVLAIRSFFWWGHYFSITLHLKGQYKEMYETKLLSVLSEDAFSTCWLNRSNEEWVHELSTEHWTQNHRITIPALQKQDVVKVAFQLDLLQWEEASFFFEEKFNRFASLLAD
jgi:hypothetical protein